ncbi:MAG: hypothetical protein ACI4O7_02510 [Aristaeellaceae bacterium]
MNHSFASASAFSLSNNHGMSDSIVARIVPIRGDRMNVTGFGRRAIVANPGCRLLFPGRDGSFEPASGCERSNLSVLRLGILQSRRAHAIEYRTGGFFVELPVTIDHGYDAGARCEDRVSYTAHCLVSIRNEGEFLSSFGLSLSTPAITIPMVQEALARSAVTLLGNDVDDMGCIMPRRLHALFNALGLFLHGSPSITNYADARAKRLREMQEAYDRDVREALQQTARADADLALKGVETFPQLMAVLAGSGLEPAETDRIIGLYGDMLREGARAVHQTHDQALKSRQAYLAEAEQRISRHGSSRPGHQDAAQLPQGDDRPRETLPQGDRPDSALRSRDQRPCEPRRFSGPEQRADAAAPERPPYARPPRHDDQRPASTVAFCGRADPPPVAHQEDGRPDSRDGSPRPGSEHGLDNRPAPRPRCKYGPGSD